MPDVDRLKIEFDYTSAVASDYRRIVLRCRNVRTTLFNISLGVLVSIASQVGQQNKRMLSMKINVCMA